MSRELPFYIHCIEQYKSAKNLTGKEVMELFEKHQVPEYIYAYFEALHTTGEKYIIQDIDLYIQARS